MDSFVVSWVIYSIREVMGLSAVRNAILRHYLRGDDVTLGKTFGAEDRRASLLRYISTVTRPGRRRYTIFTAINPPLEGETHYQSFIADHDTRILYMIDPSRTHRQRDGIYTPFAARETIAPYFEARGWTTRFIRVTHACQTSPDDVFCQSWTLVLLIRVMQKLVEGDDDPIIRIPSSQDQRYGMLLDFYKDCIRSVQMVCPTLQEIFTDHATHSSLVTEGARSKADKTRIRSRLRRQDPCRVVMEMTPGDLYP